MQFLDLSLFNKIASLEKNYFTVINANGKNRTNRAIETIWFITRIIETLYPGIIEARWFGSYEEPSVKGFPKVIVNAFHINTNQVISSWVIDTSSDSEPVILNADLIVSEILLGLKSLRKIEKL